MPIDTAIQDVVLFGADSSGRRDSTQAIQRAVDTLDGLGGGSIRMPAGQFRITASIDLRGKRAIHFQGVSGGAGSQNGTRLFVDGPGVHAFEMDATKGCGFKNLLVIRDPAIQTQPGDGFHGLNQTSDCRWDDCHVTYFDHGVFLQDSWQNYIRGCLLGYCNVGAKVDLSAGGQSNDTKFEGCLLGQCVKHELEINANTVYVVGCDFESAVSEVGVYGQFGRDCVIANCSYIHGAVLGLERLRFVGNGVANSPTHGLLLSRAHNAIVSQNVIWRSAGHGVKFFDSNDVVVDGNQILETGYGSGPFFSAVAIQDTSHRANVRNNVVRRARVGTLKGVQILVGCDGTVVWGNDLRDGYTGTPIDDQGTNSVLNANLF